MHLPLIFLYKMSYLRSKISLNLSREVHSINLKSLKFNYSLMYATSVINMIVTILYFQF